MGWGYPEVLSSELLGVQMIIRTALSLLSFFWKIALTRTMLKIVRHGMDEQTSLVFRLSGRLVEAVYATRG